MNLYDKCIIFFWYWQQKMFFKNVPLSWTYPEYVSRDNQMEPTFAYTVNMASQGNSEENTVSQINGWTCQC